MNKPQPSSNERAPSDAAALKAALASAAGKTGQSTQQTIGALGKTLKHALPDLRRDAFRNLSQGDRIAARLSASLEKVIKILFDLAPSVNGNLNDKIAICAAGGFGRGELAPFSDLDLLFLHQFENDEDIRPVLDFVLYPLWDAGLKVGYGFHSPKAAVSFAKENTIARTAYLDCRYLCGDRALFHEFNAHYDKLRRKTKTEFVAAKLDEQAVRQTKADETRYLVEPDIKEGKGGLRDLQTIRWLYKYVYGGAIGASRAIDKVMDASERRALAKAERFLWSVRVHLHDLRGRPDEQLSFDIQPQIAARLGYADRAGMTAAERLMKHYFINAVETGRLTRVLCARLEEERTKRIPHLPKLLPRVLQSDEAPGKPNLRIRNGRLDFESAAKARRRPRDLFRLFRAFSKQPQFDFHPNALAIVTEQTPKVTSNVRHDPVIGDLFNAILMQSADPVRVLRIMTETGLLGKYIPAFGAIVGRIHFGLYRRFTIDEKVLRGVGVLAQIHHGGLSNEHPIATKIMKQSTAPLIYYLAVFLHEVSWTLKDKSVEVVERLVVRITRRLGLDGDDASLAGWAVARHLKMVRTAERRNLAEMHTISSFASLVGNQQRLDLMLVLSVCHLRVVGLNTWDQVRRRQLAKLYEATSSWLDGGEAAFSSRMDHRENVTRSEIKAGLTDWTNKQAESFLGRLPSVMLRSVDPGILIRFAHLAREAEAASSNEAVTVTPRHGNFETIIYADDRTGLIADIAGAIATSGLGVRSVQALTTIDGKAIDIFTIGGQYGAPLDDQGQAQRLHASLLAAVRTTPAQPLKFKRRFGDRRQIFTVAPRVRIELAASEDALVVEAEGLDRPGLLFELARALFGLNLMITSAHVATYGERAVDTFYLQDQQGKKIYDPKIHQRIEKQLLTVLSAGSHA